MKILKIYVYKYRNCVIICLVRAIKPSHSKGVGDEESEQ
jgi:hypothetical protein